MIEIDKTLNFRQLQEINKEKRELEKAFSKQFINGLYKAESEDKKKLSKGEFLNKELIKAVIKGDANLAEALINKGADVNLKTIRGNTLLHLSVLNLNPVISLSLISKHGLSVDMGNSDGMSSVHVVSNSKSKSINAAIINNSKDIDKKDFTGHTSLHYATSDKNDAVVKLLLSKGANPTIKNDYGRTPLECGVTADNYAALNLMFNSFTIDDHTIHRLHTLAEILDKYDLVKYFEDKFPFTKNTDSKKKLSAEESQKKIEAEFMELYKNNRNSNSLRDRMKKHSANNHPKINIDDILKDEKKIRNIDYEIYGL